MDKPYFRKIFTPMLDNPIFVQGLPGFGNVGKIAAHLLIKFCGAKPFAEMYAPCFPDYVSVNADGICRLPKYEFYAAPMDKNDFIIMTGDTQPSFEDVIAHYELCGEVLDFIVGYGCNFIITLGGVPSVDDAGRVYVAATSPRLAVEFMEKGAVLYGKGRIVGAAGLTIGMAKERGLEGVCLLGATTGFRADRGAGFSVFKFLMKAMGNEVKEGL
ncbi:MAG: PAC2 family protein [Candidatus Bathyarchaeota archaeon]|nr:PAC2 family protein [Candidatus Bathyarchaeota archaeon]MDW8040037.1 PAC2 family protein [Nitrososphaerota archaeon]